MKYRPTIQSTEPPPAPWLSNVGFAAGVLAFPAAVGDFFRYTALKSSE